MCIHIKGTYTGRAAKVSPELDINVKNDGMERAVGRFQSEMGEHFALSHIYTYMHAKKIHIYTHTYAHYIYVHI